MSARIQVEPTSGDLWAETMLLMGLKYDREYSSWLLERVIRNMRIQYLSGYSGRG
jgi:hypothetical protein